MRLNNTKQVKAGVRNNFLQLSDTLKCAPTIFHLGWGGAGPDTIYKLCLILKIMLHKPCRNYNITLPATAFLYTQIQLHVP
jgi:hypothetical protein